MSAAAPTDAWALSCDAASWEAHARASCVSRAVSSECVVDVSPKTILNFAQGSHALVEADVRAVFPPRLASLALRAIARVARLPEAFALRRNVVNLKKVLLHGWHESEPLEKELRRMSTFWRSDMSFEEGFANAARQREICVAHMTLKGAAHACFDGRVVTKAICCVGRHPDAPRPRELEDLERHHTTLAWLAQAEDLVAGKKTSPRRRRTNDASRADERAAAAAAAAAARSDDDASSDTRRTPPPPDASISARAELDEFFAIATAPGGDLEGWPPHLLTHLERIFVARGGAKAMHVRAETRRYAERLESFAGRFESALETLLRTRETVEAVLRREFGVDVSVAAAPKNKKAAADGEVNDVANPPPLKKENGFAYPPPSAIAALQTATRFDRLANVLRGCAPATRDLARWVRAIVDAPTTTHFAAGDGGRGVASDFVPPGFRLPALMKAHEPVAARHREDMRRALAEARRRGEGEEEAAFFLRREKEEATREKDARNRSRPGGGPFFPHLFRGRQPCRACGGRFAALWICDGCCFACEAAARERGACPRRGAKCPPGAFCAHERKCLACDRGDGCAECGVLRADAERVAEMVFAEGGEGSSRKGGKGGSRGGLEGGGLEGAPGFECAPGFSSGAPGFSSGASGFSAVFLDFDRTVCTTKSGGSPAVGAHRCDPELLSILAAHPFAHVVTRNSHVRQIAAFLEARGVRRPSVRRVAKGESKAAAIRALLAERRREGAGSGSGDSGTPGFGDASIGAGPARTILVDDSIAELLDPEVAAVEGLTRVLFVRAMA